MLLNRCEESDNLGSQRSLLQMKQGCSATDWPTQATNTRKQMKHLPRGDNFFLLYNLTEMTSQVNELSTFQRSVLLPVKFSDPPSPCEILEAIHAGVVGNETNPYRNMPLVGAGIVGVCEHD